MKKMILAALMVFASNAMANDIGDKVAVCGGDHYGVDFDIFTNMNTNKITVRATGPEGTPTDYVITSAKSLRDGEALDAEIMDDYFILGLVFSAMKDNTQDLSNKFDGTSANGQKVSISLTNEIIFNINGFDQKSWCKIFGLD